MSAGTEPPLVGRQQELEALARLLDDLVDAPSALVLQVAGEPGIGKRGLLRELRTVAGDQGHLVFSGRAVEFEAELPFGVFGDALDDWLTDLPAERLAALAGPRATDLAGVPPAFEALAGGEAPQLEQERYRGVPCRPGAALGRRRRRARGAGARRCPVGRSRLDRAHLPHPGPPSPGPGPSGVGLPAAPGFAAAERLPGCSRPGPAVSAPHVERSARKGDAEFTFKLFSDSGCTVNVFTSLNRPLSDGTATSTSFVTTAPGTYYWTAVYSGDGVHPPSTSTCGAANESVTITPFAAPACTRIIEGDHLGPVTVTSADSVCIKPNARVVGRSPSRLAGR